MDDDDERKYMESRIFMLSSVSTVDENTEPCGTKPLGVAVRQVEVAETNSISSDSAVICVCGASECFCLGSVAGFGSKIFTLLLYKESGLQVQ